MSAQEKKRGRPPLWAGQPTKVVALILPVDVALGIDELVLRARRQTPAAAHTKGTVVAGLVRAAMQA